MLKQIIEKVLFQIYQFPSNNLENICVSLKKMSLQQTLTFIAIFELWRSATLKE